MTTEVRHLPPGWGGDPQFSTGARISIVYDVAGPAIGDWVRGLAERVDPRGQRDAAIRAAAVLLRQPSISATAKALEVELNRYLCGAWQRGDRDLEAPPAGSSALRQTLSRIARLNGGDGLAWRRILEIIEH